ncbi:lysozyme [Edwardsiella tarda]|uniref:lysozyme n=1 Tax=Edwardsiella tarda TaxID=636 RepID=UPI002444A06C|nr:lysozyme [Edwardsiella tarda]WGE29418.1 lysozyme [Edwardsiella tarda]
MPSRKTVRYGLSAAMLALIAMGASAPQLLDQFLHEREGSHQTAYRDSGGIWTICQGVTRINGKPVMPGQHLTAEQCRQANAQARDRALAWVDAHIHVPLTAPQKAGIASFCPYNIGPAKCLPSTFYRKLNAGDRRGACQEVRRWVFDGGRDCHDRENHCYGQVIRRDQESALTCWGIDL